MKNGQTKRLDETGRGLFKTAQKSDAEIEQIISRPQIFNSVMTRIHEEQISRARQNLTPEKTAANFGFGKLACVFGALAAILLGASWLLVRNSPRLDDQSQNIDSVLKTEKIQNFSSLNAIPEAPEFSENPTFTSKTKISTTTKRTLSAPRQFAAKRKAAKKSVKRDSPAAPNDADSEPFYALNDIATLEQSTVHPIIRTTISRIELYSLGANIAVENAPDTVVADLLLGSDGNPRAYRLVK